MKYIKLALGRMQGYWTHSKLIVTIFSIGVILSSFAFVFLYGNLLPGKVKESANSLSMRVYDVVLEKAGPVSEESLHCLDEYSVDDVLIDGPVAFPELDMTKYNERFLPRVFGSLQNNKGNMIYFDLFREDELSGDNVILPKSYGAHDSFLINEIRFTVVKTVDYATDNSVFIPIGAYMKHQFPVDHLQFILPQAPSGDENRIIVKRLQETFPGAQIIDAQRTADTDARDTTESIFFLCILYVVSMVSFLFLFKYLIDQNSVENIIYSIVGATKQTVLAIMAIEILIFQAIMSTISFFIHCFFYHSFVSTLNLYANITYYWYDYAIVFLLTALLSLLSALPFILNYTRLTVNELKQRYHK